MFLLRDGAIKTVGWCRTCFLRQPDPRGLDSGLMAGMRP